MSIGGVSLILLLGIVNFLLLGFQLISGLHVVKVPFSAHKTAGILLCITGAVHGVLALLVG
jgi:hypothetical protein